MVSKLARSALRHSGFPWPEQLTACRFTIDADGISVAIFAECSGLSGEIEVQTYREGGLNEYEHKLPGPTKYGNVTLRSGVADSAYLWDWFQTASTGKGTVNRMELSIIMYLQNHVGIYLGEAMRWTLHDAYPVRWEGPAFKAGDNTVAVHALELTHHGIELTETSKALRSDL